MSLITKTNPVGIDLKIDQLQRKLYSSLTTAWGISKYACTPRCYRNQTKDGYTAELFTGAVNLGNDYSELYINDTVSATSFFGVGAIEKITTEGINQADVHLIFSVNLNDIRPTPSGQRNDEEARTDVQKVLQTYGLAYGWTLNGLRVGIDKILEEYPGSRRDSGLKYKDMHPNHWFRFDLQVFYQPTQIKC